MYAHAYTRTVAALMSNGSGVVADIFSPEQRGRASGAMLVPQLVGCEERHNKFTTHA
jgi:hypothetical protein